MPRLVAQGGGVDHERHVLLLCQERLERDACFHSSEYGAQAGMLSESESEAEMSLDIRAIEPEAVRLPPCLARGITDTPTALQLAIRPLGWQHRSGIRRG